MSNPVAIASAADVAALDAKIGKVLELLAQLLAAQGSPGSTEGGAVTVAEASRLTRLGKTTLYQLIANGSIASSKIGKKRLIQRSELKRLLAESQTPA